MLEVTLPNSIYLNCGVTTDNCLIADTNDSSNWKTIKIPLPEGKWEIYKNPMGNKIILVDNERRI